VRRVLQSAMRAPLPAPGASCAVLNANAENERPAERAGAQVFADEAEIKKAYRALALQHHPDKNQGNEEEAKAAFQRVGASYERLKFPEGESSDSDIDVEFDMDDAMNMFREMCARAPARLPPERAST